MGTQLRNNGCRLDLWVWYLSGSFDVRGKTNGTEVVNDQQPIRCPDSVGLVDLVTIGVRKTDGMEVYLN